AVAPARADAGAVRREDLAVDLGRLALEPGEERGPDVERDLLEVVDDVEDAVVVVHPARGRVGRVALRRDALVPVVERRRRVLDLDGLEPRILARRLVEVSVDGDEAARRHSVSLPLELLEARQELPPAAAGNDHEPGGIDEVPPAVHRWVHADLAVRGDDVEAIDDDAPQPRALADRRVVHDDRVLDDGALVDPHGAAEDRVADGRALDQRRLADVGAVHVAAAEAGGRAGMRRGAHRPGVVGEAGGCLGFSTKSTTRPWRSTDSTPKAEASALGTERAATVTSAPVSSWKASIWFTSIR